jgi:hypothetical protein
VIGWRGRKDPDKVTVMGWRGRKDPEKVTVMGWRGRKDPEEVTVMGWRGRKDCERVRVINSMVSTSVIYGFPNLNIPSRLLEHRIMAVLTLVSMYSQHQYRPKQKDRKDKEVRTKCNLI